MRFSAILAAVLPCAAQAAPINIGAAGAVGGRVSAAAPEVPQRAVASGSAMYHKDAVTTGPAGRLQVLLNDQTVFTVGPDSRIMLDEFVYDPFTDAGKVTAQVTKGVFRFVTGKVARKQPDGMKIKLPSGTVGIRGTIAGGKVDEDGSAVIALLGPGPDNNADERPGGLTVENAGKSVDIDEPGFATRIDGPGSPPSPPFPITPELLAELGAAQPTGGGSDDDGGAANASASEESGQTTAAGGVGASDSIVFADDQNSTSETTVFGAQSILAGGGAFSWDDLRATLQSGTAFYDGTGNYSCTGGACSSGGSGTFALHFNVDWGARTLGGPSPQTSHFAFVSGPLLISAENPGSNIPVVSFSSLTGEAKLVQGTDFSGSDSNFNGSGFSFNSGGGSVAGTLKYNNGSADASGSVTSPCISGTCP